jgi:hypothetical protein
VDKNNLKALFRRAMAYIGLVDIKEKEDHD